MKGPVSAAQKCGDVARSQVCGCDVETAAGELIGVVKDVEGTMRGSRLVVDTGRGDVLVPLALEICTTIDPPRRRIVIEPPDGLLELNAPSTGKAR